MFQPYSDVAHGFRTRPLAAAALALLLLTPAAGRAQAAADWCAERDTGRNQHCEVRQLTMQGRSAEVSIDIGANGSIRVEGYSGSEVRVTARVVARARDERAAADLARQVQLDARNGEIRATGPRTMGNTNWSVSVRVQVPSGTAVEARTTNGSITAESTYAAVNARTTNGSITLSDVAGRIDARSTNGSIRATLSGAADTPESVQLRTTNGAIHLALPEGTSARIELSTSNGRINSDLPITVQGRVSSRQLSGTLGAGGPEIRAATTNGSIRVTRN